MAAAPVVAIPELSYLAVGLLFVLAFCVAYGLRIIWQYTFGAMLTMMADALNYDKWVVHIHLGKPFEAINTTVLNALGTAAAKSEHGMGYFFHGAAVILGWTARETLDLARSVLGWATWLQNSHLPKWVKALVYAAFPPALLLRLVTGALHLSIPGLVRMILAKVEAIHVPRIVKVIAATAGAVVLPGFVWHLPSRVKALEHLWHDIMNRFRHPERYIGLTAAGVLFAKALTKFGLHWLRCGKVSKFGKAICSSPTGWLDAFIAGLTIIVGSIGLATFAHEIYSGMDELAGAVRAFWRDDVQGGQPNPGLGEYGAPSVLGLGANFTPPNPGLGQAAAV